MNVITDSMQTGKETAEFFYNIVKDNKTSLSVKAII